MHSRSVLPVTILSTNLLSSITTTAVPSAIDMANYFPVGRREVLFVVTIASGTTTVAGGQVVIIEENDSTTTTSFTSVKDYSGSTATWTTAANAVPLSTYFYGVLNYRYLRARTVGTTVTGPDYNIVNIIACPIVRAG